MSQGINELVSVCENIISETANSLAALSQGDLNTTIEGPYKGAFDKLKQDTNDTISKLKTVIESDIQTLVNDAKQGNLQNRIDTSDKQGFYLCPVQRN